jgi:hypothetical protein
MDTKYSCFDKEDYNYFNNKLISLVKEENLPLGLSSGGMGIVIYFYNLSNINNNRNYTIIGKELLNDIINKVSLKMPLNIENGLIGIGLGVNYLFDKGFIQGNVNHILQDIDNYVFKNLCYSKYYSSLSTNTLVDILLYLTVRYNTRNDIKEEKIILRELVILLINNLYEKIDVIFFEESIPYSLESPMPWLLFILSRVYTLNICNIKITQILEELSPKILSILPFLQANRLLLLWGIKNTVKVFNSREWKYHADILYKNLDIKSMINIEFKDKNIFPNTGLTSIFYVLNDLNNLFPIQNINLYNKIIIERILNSSVWVDMRDESFFKAKMSLLNGYCGASLLLNTYYRNYEN